MDNRGIGVFDSGVGGISVLIEMQKRFPNETFYYYGDNFNAPYGEKGIEDIKCLSFNGIAKLLMYNIKALVVACNTLSVNLLKDIKDFSPVPVFGVFPPIERCILQNQRTLLLCTTATANYYKGIKNDNVFINPCKTLAWQIERAKTLSEIDLTTDVPKTYKNHFDTVILGCTHYVFLKNKIFDHLKPRSVISGNDFTIDFMQKSGVFNKKWAKNTKRQVFFIGDTAQINKDFFLNVVNYI